MLLGKRYLNAVPIREAWQAARVLMSRSQIFVLWIWLIKLFKAEILVPALELEKTDGCIQKVTVGMF